MKQRFTALAATLLLGALLMPAANAQITDVTIREINAISQAQIDALNGFGTNLTQQDIIDNIFNDLRLDTVRFTAVVLSDPTLSGLSTPNNGLPSRVHFFVRDTSAATLGNDGMGLQIVDAAWQENGILGLLVGDVVEIVGVVNPFGTGMQVPPETIEIKGTYADFGLPASILDPVVVTTGDLVKEVGGAGQLQANWENLASIRNQYVRIEDAVVQRRDISSDRPSWTFSSDGGATQIQIRDVSLSYRNDRFDTYNDPPFRLPADDFVPPPPGSGVNVQGFMLFYNFDPFELFTPNDAMLFIAPFERSDVEVTVTPPLVTDVSEPSTVVGTADSPTITAEVDADPTRTLASVVLKYFTTSDATEMEVAGTNTSGSTWEFTIPPAADEDFVTYWIVATDNVGAESQRVDFSYRVLAGGITKIYQIQETPDGGPGSSPFDGLTLPMNITATVVTQPSESGLWAIQDDEGLAPWSGVMLRSGDANVQALNQGDVVNITEAEVDESFGAVTELRNITMTVTGSATPPAYKAVPTSALVDLNVAEAHEGMRVRFENVTITNNDEGFGEWSFSSDGTPENAVKADDQSSAFGSSYARDTFVDGDVVAYIQGLWWFSFGEFKLVPEVATDIGGINVANEEFEVPGEYALSQNYPNPFNPSTSIQYDVPTASRVSIRVFDMLGRSVATLVDGEVAAGTHTVTFDARDLASGVYLYRLESAGKVINRSMMLMK